MEHIDDDVANAYVSFLFRRGLKDVEASEMKEGRVQGANQLWDKTKEEEGKSWGSSIKEENGRIRKAKFEINQRLGPIDEIRDEEEYGNGSNSFKQQQSSAENNKIGNSKPQNGSLGGNQKNKKDEREHYLEELEDQNRNIEKRLKEQMGLDLQNIKSEHLTDFNTKNRSDLNDQNSQIKKRKSDHNRYEDYEDDQIEDDSYRYDHTIQEVNPIVSWSYVNKHSGYNLASHSFVEKKQRRIELERKKREEATRRQIDSVDFYQPFEYDKALEEHRRTEEQMLNRIEELDRKIEELHKKRISIDHTEGDLPKLTHFPIQTPQRKYKEPIPLQREAGDMVKQLAIERKEREERMRKREEKKFRKLMEEEQTKKEEKAKEEQMKKNMRQSRAQGNLMKMEQKRQVFSKVNKYQNQVLKDLMERPKVVHYFKPSEEALERVRKRMNPIRFSDDHREVSSYSKSYHDNE